jgi:UDP-N-acetylmuramate dehydrogenase
MPGLMKIQSHIDLKPLNSFGLSATARNFFTLKDLDELEVVQEWHQAHPDLPVLFLGGGSNILFVADFPGLVVRIGLQGLSLLEADEDYHYVQAHAGENWHRCVRWCIDQGFPGLENLSLIPGTVGAAPMQNIGAYGVELKDRLHQVEAIDWQTGKTRTFDRDACRFGYRDSYFKSIEPGRWLIASVILRLPRNPEWKTDYPGIRERLEGVELNARSISDAVIALRKSKLPDPDHLGNAGSFFKNPMLPVEAWRMLQARFPDIPGWTQPNGLVKTSAAWLIDRCGWKGARDGDAGTYDTHALVIVNHGNASGLEIWHFASRIITSVEDHFGITLEPEPRVIGALPR